MSRYGVEFTQETGELWIPSSEWRKGGQMPRDSLGFNWTSARERLDGHVNSTPDRCACSKSSHVFDLCILWFNIGTMLAQASRYEGRLHIESSFIQRNGECAKLANAINGTDEPMSSKYIARHAYQTNYLRHINRLGSHQ